MTKLAGGLVSRAGRDTYWQPLLVQQRNYRDNGFVYRLMKQQEQERLGYEWWPIQFWR